VNLRDDAQRRRPLDAVDAVLIDLGGVVYLPDHDRVRHALAPFGVVASPEQLDRAHYEGVAALAQHMPVGHHADGSAIWHSYNRAYAQVCGVDDGHHDAAVRALLDEFGRGDVWTREVPGARQALADLAACDVAIAVVSNADGTIEEQLRTDGLCQVGAGAGVVVGAVLDSTVVGVAKPDPEIFRLALRALDVAPERAIHVGDTPSADVAGAVAAGVRPVLVDPYDLHPDAGCVRVPSLAAVVTMLGE